MFLSMLSTARVGLGVVMFTALLLSSTGAALAFRKDTLHLQSGQVISDCRVHQVVGTHIDYRCGIGKRATLNRLLLQSQQDQITLRNGQVLTGQLIYSGGPHYELRTEAGLQRIHWMRIRNIALGVPTTDNGMNVPTTEMPLAPSAADPFTPPPDAPATQQGTVVGGAADLREADNEGVPLLLPEWEGEENTLSSAAKSPGSSPPDNNAAFPPQSMDALEQQTAADRIEAQPTSDSSALEQEPPTVTSTTTEPQQATLRQSRPKNQGNKPIRRRITPMTSPWKTDKPYTGVEALY